MRQPGNQAVNVVCDLFKRVNVLEQLFIYLCILHSQIVYTHRTLYVYDFYISIASSAVVTSSAAARKCIQVGGGDIQHCDYQYKWPASFNAKVAGQFAAVVSVENDVYATLTSGDYKVNSHATSAAGLIPSSTF